MKRKQKEIFQQELIGNISTQNQITLTHYHFQYNKHEGTDIKMNT